MRAVGVLVVGGLAVMAACGGGGDTPVDAHGDARSVDGRPLDGLPLDAAPDAAPAGLAFTQTTYDAGAVGAFEETTNIQVKLVNHSSETLPVPTVVSTGPFSVDVTHFCTPLEPGDSCFLFIHIAATALGPFSGDITATAGGFTATTTLTGTGEAYVEADVQGGVGGTVTIDPPGTPCGSGNCYADGTAVTLTAHPAANHVVTWSKQACGTALTCTVTANVMNQIISATFAGNASALDVSFAGTAAGQVEIRQAGELVARCTGSCSVGVDSAQAITIAAATPADFGGFTGCVASGVAQQCTIAAGAASLVTVTFDGQRNEHDILVDGRVFSASFDSAGDLVIGTDAQIEKLSPTFTPLWTVAMAGFARVGPTGDVFVLTATALVKLDANGVQQWTKPASLPVDLGTGTLGHDFAPMPGGGVALAGTSALTIYAPDGSIVATPALARLGRQVVGVDGAGTIYVGVESTNGDTTDLQVFGADGTPKPDLLELAPGHNFALAIDGTGHLVLSSSGHQLIAVSRNAAADGTSVFTQQVSLGSVAPNGVAADAAGDVAWLYAPDDAFEAGMHLTELSATGTTQWSIDRPVALGQTVNSGFAISDVATTSTKVAVVGLFAGFTRRGVVEVFDR